MHGPRRRKAPGSRCACQKQCFGRTVALPPQALPSRPLGKSPVLSDFQNEGPTGGQQRGKLQTAQKLACKVSVPVFFGVGRVGENKVHRDLNQFGFQKAEDVVANDPRL